MATASDTRTVSHEAASQSGDPSWIFWNWFASRLGFTPVGAIAIIVCNVLPQSCVYQDSQRFSSLHTDLMQLPDPATVNPRLIQSFVMVSTDPLWCHMGIITRMDQM